jgi:hypothetical protein
MAVFLRLWRPNVQFPMELKLTQRATGELDGALRFRLPAVAGTP